MAKKKAAKSQEVGNTLIPKLEKFLAGYPNASSRAGYKTAIESFLRFIYGLKKEDIKSDKIPVPDYNSLFEMYLISKRDNDADYIQFSEHLIETRPALSAKQSMTAIRYVMTNHGINIRKGGSQDIRSKTIKGSAATVDRVLNTKIINAALQHCTIQGKALFLCLASSGSKLNEMLSVNISDVDFKAHPVKITFSGTNTKNGQQRYTFISDEATAAVQGWLKVRDQYIQMSNAKSKKLIEMGRASIKTSDDTRLFPFSDASVTGWWNAAIEKSAEMTNDDVTGRNRFKIHGFRKFFLSELSLIIGKEIPEFLAGHSAYLSDSYRQYDDETVAAEYLKAMHIVSFTGNKQVKELESEIKMTIQEQAAIAKNENMNLKQEIAAMQKKMQKQSKEAAVMLAMQKKMQKQGKQTEDMLATFANHIENLKEMLSNDAKKAYDDQIAHGASVVASLRREK